MCDICNLPSTSCTLPGGQRVCNACATVYFQALMTFATVHLVEVTLTPQGPASAILAKVAPNVIQSFNEAAAFSAFLDDHKAAIACAV